MIKAIQKRDHIAVAIKGKKSSLQTELTVLLKGLMDKDVMKREELEQCLNIACMTEEELDRAYEARLREFKAMVESLKNETFDLTKINEEVKSEPKKRGRKAKNSSNDKETNN